MILKLRSAPFKQAIIIKFGGNAYQHENLSLPLVSQPNHAEVIKGTAPKLALMKGTHSYRPRDP